MAEPVQDDLDRLLADVARTISENDRFLKSLDEDVDPEGGRGDAEGEAAEEEEYEEL